MIAPATYQDCLAEESLLVLPAFNGAIALELGLTVLEVARRLTPKPVALHIDNLSHPLFTHFMDGTGPGNWDWIGKKSRVVGEFRHSSWAVGLDHQERGLNFNDATKLDADRYRAEGGSIPICVKDLGCVGSLTISGLQGFEDHFVAVSGLREWLSSKQ